MRVVGLVAFAFIAGCGPAPTIDVPEQQTASVADAGATTDPGRLWVAAQYIDRYTCPSEECGTVGWLAFRQAVGVFERRGEWVRVSRTYDASCRDGVSAYVDKGPATCTPENGITDGWFAEWVLAKDLSATRPDDPSETATADERLVAQSDDFAQHRAAFVRAARQLIEEGRCTAAEFEEMGGWAKSVSEPDRPVYFTYCGSSTAAGRLYLNAATGEIYR